MSEGVLMRVLPDGGHEFVLEDPVLASIVVSGQIALVFGRTVVTVSGHVTLVVDGATHWLDTAHTSSLAPLLSCYPGTARWLWSTPAGQLTLVFMQGQRIVVPGARARTAWSVGATPWGVPAP